MGCKSCYLFKSFFFAIVSFIRVFCFYHLVAHIEILKSIIFTTKGDNK